jgi:hypothetical protein
MMQVSFDHYTLQRDVNGKVYTILANEPGAKTIYQAQQVTTGQANSLIVSQIELPAKTVLLNVVSLNADQLAKKLLSYKVSEEPHQQDISCR